MTEPKRPRIACIGVSDWDRLIAVDTYPAPGDAATVTEEISAPGGPTTNTAVALSRLGAEVTLVSAIGGDERGELMLASLRKEDIAIDGIIVRPGHITTLCNVIVSREPLDRTFLIERGAQLERHDRLDVARLLGGDVLVLDAPDVSLRRFLLDLPSHTVPTVQILGPLNYLAKRDLSDAFELALQHDAIVSNEPDLLDVTGTWTLGDAVAALQSRMKGQNLRAAFVTRGAEGCRVVTETNRWNLPAFRLDVIDPTGAGDAFAAGVAWGMAQRWSWPEIGRFANAVGGLACCALGAQTSLPSVENVEALLANQPMTVD
jgi:sugar/nucleoside kinase (ribokinase family)